jgi:hypothetical protein
MTNVQWLSLKHAPYNVCIASETTGENLAELFLITLENFGIVIDNMRAQGYDACLAFIEVFKPGLGNGFQQCNTYIVRRKLLHAVTIFSHIISPLIPIISFCISGDVYFILELGTGLSK